MSGGAYVREYSVTTTATRYYPPVRTRAIKLWNQGSVQVRVFFDHGDVGTNSRALILEANGSDGDYFEGEVALETDENEEVSNRGGMTLQTASSTATLRATFIAA